MSSDDPPPRPATIRPLPFFLAVLALLGAVLAIAGADTTIVDATGAAPILDDAARQDPVQCEHTDQDPTDAGIPGVHDHGAEVTGHRLDHGSASVRAADGCSPPTLRGPPGA